ncbi:hypothetical protein ARMSODRAFT_64740 [Armillaria solidipes]|uniref:Uncharacterized protein n=1 Tax=Armillaria solidipes TaxID=1076256 RepID=A0A2H3BVX0_9AGAR|nr:hypothetical protein ARMSODRAFT_64740 [Armillaria solidipes]
MESSENRTGDPSHPPAGETRTPAAAATEGAHSQNNVPSGTYLGLRNQLHFGGLGVSGYFNFSAMIFNCLQALLHATIRRTTLLILIAKRCPKTHEYGLPTMKKPQI